MKAEALRATCSCRHATTRVPESRPQALELAHHQTALGDQLELLAADGAKWMSVHRCRRCGAYWGEDSMSSGHAELGFIFPIETGDPHAWLAGAESLRLEKQRCFSPRTEIPRLTHRTVRR